MKLLIRAFENDGQLRWTSLDAGQWQRSKLQHFPHTGTQSRRDKVRVHTCTTAWISGGREGPHPTKQAAVHGPMRSHLPAATTTSAGIILLFLSYSWILSWLLCIRLNSIQENKKGDSNMFNGVFPCIGLQGVLASTEQVFQQWWDLERRSTRV